MITGTGNGHLTKIGDSIVAYVVGTFDGLLKDLFERLLLHFGSETLKQGGIPDEFKRFFESQHQAVYSIVKMPLLLHNLLPNVRANDMMSYIETEPCTLLAQYPMPPSRMDEPNRT